MRGHIRRRGEPGSWEYIVDGGMAAAQRCETCHKRVWKEMPCSVGLPKGAAFQFI